MTAKKIACVIVTYNRSRDLKMNIEMLSVQTLPPNKVFVINNNSSDDTIETVKSFNNPIIELINLPENIGGAGGFSYGTKKAYEDGFDYIVLMDDDGRAYDKDTLKNLVQAAESSEKGKMMLNSLVFENEKKLSFGLGKDITDVKSAQLKAINGLIMNRINPFNGTLVSRELVSAIGFPNELFFIKGDEADYRQRAAKDGAFIATVVSSLYYHPSINNNNKKFLFLSIQNDLEAPWKEYYRARNYSFSNGKKYKKEINLRLLKNFIIHDEYYCSRKVAIKKGYCDGISGRLGKTVLPGTKDF